MTRPARFTQQDIVRAFKAADKVEREVRVVISPDGNIVIEPVEIGEKREEGLPKLGRMM